MPCTTIVSCPFSLHTFLSHYAHQSEISRDITLKHARVHITRTILRYHTQTRMYHLTQTNLIYHTQTRMHHLAKTNLRYHTHTPCVTSRTRFLDTITLTLKCAFFPSPTHEYSVMLTTLSSLHTAKTARLKLLIKCGCK